MPAILLATAIGTTAPFSAMSGAVIAMSPDFQRTRRRGLSPSLRLLASNAALFQSANADAGSTPALIAAATTAKLPLVSERLTAPGIDSVHWYDFQKLDLNEF